MRRSDNFELDGDIYTLGGINHNFLRQADWGPFVESWNDLKQDKFMGDGGTYRFRRYSEFKYEKATKTLKSMPHAPYRQTREHNPLNGGIDRLFEPVAETIKSNNVFQKILTDCCNGLAAPDWWIQVFQNRIYATNNGDGRPTPEGTHRDGVDNVLSLLIGRKNIIGGESTVYAPDGKTVLATFLMEAPGDFIFLDDTKTQHGVVPVSRKDPALEGYRDVLIVMLTAWQ